MTFRAPVVALLLTAAGYLAAGPGGFTSCYGEQTRAPSWTEKTPAEALANCSGYAILPIGLTVTAGLVAFQGRRKETRPRA